MLSVVHMTSQPNEFGFSGLDEGWDFAEGTGEFPPVPSICEPPTFLPVICLVSSISQLRPEDLASFSAPNLAMANDTDKAMSSDAWFQKLRSTAVDVAPLPVVQAQPELAVEVVSRDLKPHSKLRSIWKRFTAR